MMGAAPVNVTPHLGDVQSVVVEAFVDTGSWLGTGTVVPVELLSGSVTDDRGQKWRRAFSGVLHPETPAVLTEPYGNRLIVRQGIALPDGTIAMAGLFLGRLQSRSRSGLGAWQVTAKSLESQVADASFLAPTTVENDSAVADITRLILEAVPDAVVAVDGRVVDARLPAVTGDDRWAMIRGEPESIATALSVDVFCDGDGIFQVTPVPTLEDDPVEVIAAGGLLVSFDEEASRDGVANRVYVVSDRVGDDQPDAAGMWEDDAPGSKTFVGGPFGVVTETVSNSVLTTNEQAVEMARTVGLSRVGLKASVDLSGVHNPWRSAGDVVTVLGEDGVPQRFILDRVTTQVGGGAQTAATRRGEP